MIRGDVEIRRTNPKLGSFWQKRIGSAHALCQNFTDARLRFVNA